MPALTCWQVEALFARVQREQGRLDLLVNAVWGGNELPSLQADWGRPCWQQQQGPAAGWEAMFTAGVRPALIGGTAVCFAEQAALLSQMDTWLSFLPN